MNFFRSIRQVLTGAALLLAAAGPAQAANTAFNGAAVAGCSYAAASQTYTCSALPLVNDTDSISIASGYTVAVSAAVSFSFNQGLTMSGSAALQTSGDLNIGDIKPANLAVSGGSLTTGGNFKIGAQAQTITANVTAATMSIGTGSATRITGSLTSSGTIDLASHVTIVGPISGTTITTDSPVDLTGDVTASNAFTLASGSDLVGNITAPTVTLAPSSVTVKGNIAAATSLSIGSGNAVNGNVSGGALTLSPSGASITGNVALTGDVDIGSGDNITGNLVAHNVTTESSNGYISGNASVNAITFKSGGYVGGTITCTAPGASGCSCVTNGSGRSQAPVCGAAAQPGLDHILITQSGSGLTCQPSPVTLTACADSACATLYSNTVTVTTQPGGQVFTVSNGTNNSATVQQSTVGVATLSATTPATANPSACKNTGNGSTTSCAMTFSDAGLLLSVPNHLSDSAAALTLNAVQKNTTTSACVPMFANTTQTIAFACGYANPASGTLPVRITSSANVGVPLASSATSACSAGGANVSLAFNANGVATPTLQYADVGQMSLSASYVPPGGASTPVLQGSTSFIVAPAAFGFVITELAAPNTVDPRPNPDGSQPVFLRAGDPFKVVLSAINSSGNVTKNFGSEASPESYNLKQALVLPTTCSDTVTPSNCNPLVGSFANLSQGSATANPMTWNEVGVFSFTAKLVNANGYLNAGAANFTTSGTVNVGRFIPDHFETALVPANGVPMSCPPGLSGCPAANQMVYSNQPFAVSVVAKGPPNAVNVSNTMINYQGALAGPVSFSGWAHAGSIAAADKNPPSLPSNNNAMSGTVAASQFITGAAAPTLAVPQTVQYNFNSIAPNNTSALAAPTVVYLRALDTDLAAMAAVPATTGAGASGVEPPVMVVSGSQLVSNNYGSEVSPTPVTVKAQYWTGKAYTNSTTDNNTTGYSLATTGISFTNCTQHLATGATAGFGQPNCSAALKLKTSPAMLVFSNGLAKFLLAPPGSGNSGASDITINTTSPSLNSFLPSSVTPGRSTFGVYRAGPVIYLREVY